MAESFNGPKRKYSLMKSARDSLKFWFAAIGTGLAIFGAIMAILTLRDSAIDRRIFIENIKAEQMISNIDDQIKVITEALFRSNNHVKNGLLDNKLENSVINAIINADFFIGLFDEYYKLELHSAYWATLSRLVIQSHLCISTADSAYEEIVTQNTRDESDFGHLSCKVEMGFLIGESTDMRTQFIALASEGVRYPLRTPSDNTNYYPEIIEDFKNYPSTRSNWISLFLLYYNLQELGEVIQIAWMVDREKIREQAIRRAMM